MIFPFSIETSMDFSSFSWGFPPGTGGISPVFCSIAGSARPGAYLLVGRAQWSAQGETGCESSIGSNANGIGKIVVLDQSFASGFL